jgi:hypothetical protein
MQVVRKTGAAALGLATGRDGVMTPLLDGDVI